MLHRVGLELFFCRSMVTGNLLHMLCDARRMQRQDMHKLKKELLCMTYACGKSHHFVSWQAISVETDHKPLIALFQKPLNDCPLRIQRRMMRLQRYTLNVMYTPGKLMYTADTSSRAFDPKEPENTEMDNDVKAYVNMIMSALPVADGKMKLIRTETSKDDTQKKLCAKL